MEIRRADAEDGFVHFVGRICLQEDGEKKRESSKEGCMREDDSQLPKMGKRRA